MRYKTGTDAEVLMYPVHPCERHWRLLQYNKSNIQPVRQLSVFNLKEKNISLRSLFRGTSSFTIRRALDG